nr:DUF3422 family protein [Iodidimonas nitroreducens]
MQIPVDHPERFNLNDEVHARPPEPLPTPCRVSYLALYTDWHLAPSDLEPVTELARRFQAVEPRPSSNHYSADFGRFRLRWERHTEYTAIPLSRRGWGKICLPNRRSNWCLKIGCNPCRGRFWWPNMQPSCGQKGRHPIPT